MTNNKNITLGEILKIKDSTTNEKLLNELYSLTQIENERELTEKERNRYVEIVDYLQSEHVEIDFAINI